MRRDAFTSISCTYKAQFGILPLGGTIKQEILSTEYSCTWSTVHLVHGSGADLGLNLTPLAKKCQAHFACDHIKNDNKIMFFFSTYNTVELLEILTIAGEQNISGIEVSTQDALLMQTLQS